MHGPADTTPEEDPMFCQCVHHFGQPLRGETRDDMKPQGHEVILSVVAAGVCHSDLHVREGGYSLGHGRWMSYEDRGVKLPLVMGHETVGRIVAAGPEAGTLDASRNYVVYPWCGCGNCDLCKAGEEQLCLTPRFLGIHKDGGYATQIRVPHPRYLFDIGDLDPQFAAPLACSGLTTYAAIKKIRDTVADHHPVVIGAGGLGLMCLQLLAALGSKPAVVVEIDPAKREAAMKAGAHATVDPKAEDAIARIHAACGGAPHAAIDFVGAESTAELGFNCLAKAGTLVTVGLFGGAAPWALPLIALRSAVIRGSYTGSPTEFAELMELARKGAIRPIPTRKYPLAEAEDVLNMLEQGKVIGRAILDPELKG